MGIGIADDIDFIRPLEPFQLNRYSSQARGLMAWWPMAFPFTFDLQDFSGKNKFGTFVGATWAIDPERGPVVNFDGSGDRVDCGQTAYSSSEGISISMWFYWNGTPAGFDIIAAQVTDSNWADGWGFYTNGSQTQLHFFIQEWNTNFASIALPSANTWHHLIGTWDRATVRIYVDDVEGTSDVYSGSITETAMITLGEGGAGFDLNGKLQDFRIYNRALSAAEARALYDPQTRWELYAPLTQRFWVFTAAGGVDIGAYQLETSTDHYLLEDASGAYLLEETEEEVGETYPAGYRKQWLNSLLRM
jgi:hypothetical protein